MGLVLRGWQPQWWVGGTGAGGAKVGCKHFVGWCRGGSAPGAVEALLDAPQKQDLEQAGFTLGEPEGAVFKLFGWIRVDPMQGDPTALGNAVQQAFAKARAKPAKK